MSIDQGAHDPGADAALVEFAAKGRMTLFPANDAMLRIGDLEQLYELRERDGRFELTLQQGGAAPRLLMSSTSLAAVRRYLLRSIGVTVRATLGMRRVALPFDRTALPDGFVLRDDAELAWSEQGDAVSARFRAGSAGERDAVQFARYADASERTLIDALLDADGGSMFPTA
ncbi:TNT antitoxin family protein [Agromyces sp. SYSU K20354]|uniref:Imm61 family immunity protein n=1 Tax=Agromyces cavernae TaxID=2898659 RepID=UPI001E55F5AE|nr:Imm61 family immunity protein [Agromyces cavernae]MCD2441634.1 TNT antitoxin family protein [Agromyces cavernae]